MSYYPEQARDFVVCIKTGEYVAALEIGKIYSLLPDAEAMSMQMLRIIDESGEDYVYPADYFISIDLPQLQTALRRAA